MMFGVAKLVSADEVTVRVADREMDQTELQGSVQNSPRLQDPVKETQIGKNIVLGGSCRTRIVCIHLRAR